jgi:hypothetical protein
VLSRIKANENISWTSESVPSWHMCQYICALWGQMLSAARLGRLDFMQADTDILNDIFGSLDGNIPTLRGTTSSSCPGRIAILRPYYQFDFY